MFDATPGPPPGVHLGEGDPDQEHRVFNDGVLHSGMASDAGKGADEAVFPDNRQPNLARYSMAWLARSEQVNRPRFEPTLASRTDTHKPVPDAGQG